MLCRFLATPSLVFEKKATDSDDEMTVQQFAITRLAQCVQVCLKLLSDYLFTHIFNVYIERSRGSYV